MKKTTHNFVYHSADSRGSSDFGKVKARHTFSFHKYHDPERTHFGALRALNDGLMAPGFGADPNPHSNMEILFIPLRGRLQHKDSLGNLETIKADEHRMQLISAGRGIVHSEVNPSHTTPLNIINVWILPNKQYLAPCYQQIAVEISKTNHFHQIFSPHPEDTGGCIQQNAWGFMADLTEGSTVTYELQDPANGVYVFVIFGTIAINGHTLNDRDGYGIWTVDGFDIACNADAQVLLLEVPMWGYT